MKTRIAARVLTVLAILVYTTVALNLAKADPAPNTVNATTTLPTRFAAQSLQVENVTGQHISPLKPSDKAAICLIFISTACPISDTYAPEISRISATFAKSRIATYAVLTDDDISLSDAASYAKEYAFTCPVLLDSKHQLVEAAGATVTPEAVVYDKTLRLIYRGRIDNRYADFGVAREEATQRDLRAILTTVALGKTIKFSETKAIGCFIPPLPG